MFNCRVAKLRLARRLDLYLLYLCLHEAPNGKEGAAGKGRRDSSLPLCPLLGSSGSKV